MKHWHKLLLLSSTALLSPQVLAHDNSLATGLLAGALSSTLKETAANHG